MRALCYRVATSLIAEERARCRSSDGDIWNVCLNVRAKCAESENRNPLSARLLALLLPKMSDALNKGAIGHQKDARWPRCCHVLDPLPAR